MQRKTSKKSAKGRKPGRAKSRRMQITWTQILAKAALADLTSFPASKAIMQRPITHINRHDNQIPRFTSIREAAWRERCWCTVHSPWVKEVSANQLAAFVPTSPTDAPTSPRFPDGSPATARSGKETPWGDGATHSGSSETPRWRRWRRDKNLVVPTQA